MPIYTVNCQFFALNLYKFTAAKKIYTGIPVAPVTNIRYASILSTTRRGELYVTEKASLLVLFTVHHRSLKSYTNAMNDVHSLECIIEILILEEAFFIVAVELNN